MYSVFNRIPDHPKDLNYSQHARAIADNIAGGASLLGQYFWTEKLVVSRPRLGHSAFVHPARIIAPGLNVQVSAIAPLQRTQCRALSVRQCGSI
jgi:hypothetical protein